MKKVVFWIVCMSLCWSFSAFAEEMALGKPLTVKEKTELSAILEAPEEFLGKQVLVEGLIIKVCPSRGCWIDIIGEKSPEKIRVKVLDGEIVFPLEIKGRNVLVEGMVYKIVYDKEGHIILDTSDLGQQEKKHSAGEKHDEQEHSKDSADDEDIVVYQIRGLGAVVK